jgi:hypothetical protein
MLPVIVPAQVLWEFFSGAARPWNALGPWIVTWGRSSSATAPWIVLLATVALAVISIAAFLIWLARPALARAPGLRHHRASGGHEEPAHS